MTVAGLVLCAGAGMRLGPFTRSVPKPLLPIVGQPLIEYPLRAVEDAGVTDIYVNLHHGADALARYLDGRSGPAAVHHRVEPRLFGPAGALVTFADRLRSAEFVLVSSGDVVFADDLQPLIATHRRMRALLTFAVTRSAGARRYGVLDLDDRGLVLAAREKPDVPDDAKHWISCGVYCVDPAIVDEVARLLDGRETVDFARDLAPELLRQGETVATHPLRGYWTDVGTPAALHRANLDAVTGAITGGRRAGRSVAHAGPGTPTDVFVHPHAKVGTDVSFFGPSVVCAGATVGDGCRLAEAVLLPDARLGDRATVFGGLVGGDGIDVVRAYGEVAAADVGEGVGEATAGPAGVEEDRSRRDSPLAELFDQRYLQFWGGELAGERLARDVRLVRMLGAFANGQEVLDLACGYGRLSNELQRTGLRVTGMDLSKDLLREARRRAEEAGLATTFVRGDMRLPILGTYDAVLLWFTSFGYFGHADNVRVLRNVHAALRPGGVLLLETRHWDRMERRFEPTTVRASGADWLIERHTYLPETGIQETYQTLLLDGRPVERTSSVRRYGFPELRELCRAVGFDEVLGLDEQGTRLAVDSDRCIVVARRR
jgi:NDP-sugar pyrophosphorylase family protein/SAM-dependent methyltransferase